MITQVKLQPVIILTHKDQTQVYPLSQSSLTVGRSSHCEISVCHGQVSRCQSTIRLSHCGQRYLIFDGDGAEQVSRNGTYVNWVKVKWCYLEPEDVICFGSPAVVAKFCLVEQVAGQLKTQPLRQKIEDIPTELILPFHLNPGVYPDLVSSQRR